MEQTVTSSTIKGIVLSLILIILALATYLFNIDPQGPSRYISFVIYIVGIIISINIYGKQIDHNSTFGGYFAHGFKVAAFVTCIMILYVIIFFYFSPDAKEKAMEVGRKSLESKGQLTQEQIDTSLVFMRKFFMVSVIGATLLGYLIFGALASLIGAGITKKNPRPFAEG